MKRILFWLLILTLPVSLLISGGEVLLADEIDKKFLDVEIREIKEEGVTIFHISGFQALENGADPWDQKVIPYLTQYYFEKGNFKDISISCFLEMAVVFPSKEYDEASDRALRLYNAFLGKGVPEERLFVSVRFEKDAPDNTVISVEFFDGSNYFQRVGQNFVGGIADIVLSPVELPKEMVDESREKGAAAGLTKGTFSGFGKALRKAGNGTIKLLTFWAG
jgi:putative exosortase-associated protein (TIGR04073 family)